MFINIRGKKIHYRMRGQGVRTMILVHGWGGSIESLEKLSCLLSKKYVTITLDLPGFGQSQLPDPDWGVEEYSQVLLGLLKQLGIKKTVYFGHSFGGSLGVYIASHYQVIDGLILCGASFKRDNVQSQTTKRLKKMFRSAPFLNRFEMLIKKFYYRIFFPNSDLIRYPSLENNFKKIMAEDMTGYLDKIKTKVLVVWGEEDKQTPLDLALLLKKKIPQAKLTVFPDIGHNLPLAFPEKVYQEIDKFL